MEFSLSKHPTFTQHDVKLNFLIRQSTTEKAKRCWCALNTFLCEGCENFRDCIVSCAMGTTKNFVRFSLISNYDQNSFLIDYVHNPNRHKKRVKS